MANKCAGVDEAGRGPLAGPVIAAAVILKNAYRIKGLDDSKLLTAKRREELFEQIQEQAVAWAVGRAEVEEIDSLNIFQATLLAMQRAVAALPIAPELVLVDGAHTPIFGVPAAAIVDGDQHVPVISAASIMAKVTRDREMLALDTIYPHYGFAQHKGYGTAMHLKAIKQQGPCLIHRRSFAPIKHYTTTAL